MYKPEEINILIEGFQNERNSEMVLGALRAYGEPRNIMPGEVFGAFLSQKLARQCTGPFAALLARERVMADMLLIEAFHRDFTHQLAAEAPRRPASLPSRPVPAPAAAPPPAASPEGLPLDERFADLAMTRLGLESRDARNALLPRSFRGSTLTAARYPYGLYHETMTSTMRTGAVGDDGRNKITFFYIQKEGRALLVAWGHHIVDKHGRTTYRVDKAYDAESGLKGQILQFR